ncbi:class I tRNA ligase family protein, partial [Candidatus Dojkabacteria bacterium]|nr:class I tRNA ligase family protein [Candidatus Dojkabacteria bacterium]
LSRNRYWGTPLPVWVCDQCGKKDVLGSFEEVKQKSVVELKDPHKPFVDEIVYKCECGGDMKRVNDVIDVWYDSGSMPFARFHYPFENKELFENKYPGEFIAEGVDQTRGWFYTLHVLGVGLFGKKAFKNVIVNGMALAPDGTKMSKSKRNYPEVYSVIDSMGADALRLYFLSSPIVHGEEVIFSEKFVKEITSTVLIPYYNCIKYLLSYKENLSTFESKNLKPKHIMDRWILSKLNQTIRDVTVNIDQYKLQNGVKYIFDLIDVLSKWYIRRSRDRFVNGDLEALNTLQFVLIEISKLLAPFAPFISESAYLTLNTSGKESVHLEEYPILNEELLDEKLNIDMEIVRNICSIGLNIRDENRLKVRQTLSKAYVPISDLEMLDIIKGELNVKEVVFSKDEVQGEHIVSSKTGEEFVSIDTLITQQLKEEGLLNEILRGLQVARKESGCKVGEYISLQYQSDKEEIPSIIEKFKEEIKKAIYIKELEDVKNIDEGFEVKIGEEKLTVKILRL